MSHKDISRDELDVVFGHLLRSEHVVRSAVDKISVDDFDIQNEFAYKLLWGIVSDFFKQYGISEERLKKCKPDIVVMHPGPINRGVEMSSGVADGQNSVILEQVTNGIAVRMAVLYLVAHARLPDAGSHAVGQAKR